jgi:membrane protein DedA with SNARE-associated domain
LGTLPARGGALPPPSAILVRLPPVLAALATALLAAAAHAAVAHGAAAPDALAGGARTPLQLVGVYLSLAIGPITVEELAPLGAGVAASQREIALWPAIAVMTLGGWAATAILYAVGRWRGRWIRRRFPRAGGVIKRLLRAVRRRPWRSALAVRYAFGARVLLPLACGAAHVRPDVYLTATFVSSASWSALFALLGFWFGETALEVLARVQAYDQYIAAVAVGLAVLAWLVIRRRRRVAVGGATAAVPGATPAGDAAPPVG